MVPLVTAVLMALLAMVPLVTAVPMALLATVVPTAVPHRSTAVSE